MNPSECRLFFFAVKSWVDHVLQLLIG